MQTAGAKSEQPSKKTELHRVRINVIKRMSLKQFRKNIRNFATKKKKG